MLEENRWRASRYGLDGKMIDFGKMMEVPTRQLVRELLELVGEEVEELGIRAYLQPIEQMLMHGTSADRQLRVYDMTDGDLQAVVDHLLAETALGLDL
jgi:carboxylate-amine ligase